MGFHDAVPRPRVPLPPCEELCGDVKGEEDKQMHQVEWAHCQVSCLWLRRPREPSGRELGWWGRIIHHNIAGSQIIMYASTSVGLAQAGLLHPSYWWMQRFLCHVITGVTGGGFKHVLRACLFGAFFFFVLHKYVMLPNHEFALELLDKCSKD